MRWKTCTMAEALEFAQGKTIDYDHDSNYYNYDVKPSDNAEVVYFTDRTAVASESSFSGPYSEVTPDIDIEPPDWWIGTPWKRD